MKKGILIILLFVYTQGYSQLNIVPVPAEITMGKGSFKLSPSTKINLQGANLERLAGLLNEYLLSTAGFTLETSKTTAVSDAIILQVDKKLPSVAGAYNLNSTTGSVTISAETEAGILNGIQTLIQMIPQHKAMPMMIPYVSIKDYPRFAYRGMHLDVARHFFPVSFIKKYIDYLAAYKFNTFHWHLTDDQGWRIEIKKYPRLTSIGGYRNGTIIGRYPGKGNDSNYYGGFYTQEQIKEVVQYASDRYIDVIPEIEMPGHASAAIAAYPQLSCFQEEDTKILKSTPWAGSRNGKQVQQTWGVFEDVFNPSEYTFNFLQDVLDEVMVLFPSKYVHIGGDECPKESWKRSEFCQQLIKDKNLKDEHGLQSYFIQRIEKYINSKGKKIIGWDEILEGGLAPNATVMSWRGEQGGIEAARQNHDVIMTPGTHCYFDHSQSKNEDSVTIGSYLPVEKVYSYEPIPAVLSATQAKFIMGAQANLWTEYVKNPSKVEYMIFPRMIALSEVLWSPKTKRNWKDFERRLPVFFDRLKKQKINFSKANQEPKISIAPTPAFNGLQLAVKANQQKAHFYFGNKTESQFAFYHDSINTILKKSGEYGIRLLGKKNPTSKGEAWGKTSLSPYDYNFSSDIKISFNKATGKKITLANPPSKGYPGDGAFTLVNGVQNEKGLAKGNEFVGFSGADLDATIDLGKETEVSQITLHTLHQNGSWIYLPTTIEVSLMPDIDTKVITKHAPIEAIIHNVTDEKNEQLIQLVSPKTCRYVRVVAKNYGIIPTGKPGAGNPAWLFADEIEVK
jgi:hexosaminidase